MKYLGENAKYSIRIFMKFCVSSVFVSPHLLYAESMPGYNQMSAIFAEMEEAGVVSRVNHSEGLCIEGSIECFPETQLWKISKIDSAAVIFPVVYNDKKAVAFTYSGKVVGRHPFPVRSVSYKLISTPHQKPEGCTIGKHEYRLYLILGAEKYSFSKYYSFYECEVGHYVEPGLALSTQNLAKIAIHFDYESKIND